MWNCCPEEMESRLLILAARGVLGCLSALVCVVFSLKVCKSVEGFRLIRPKVQVECPFVSVCHSSLGVPPDVFWLW